jgi:hypothetical protein
MTTSPTPDDFRIGDRVCFIPSHLGTPSLHDPADCELGVVTHLNAFYIFVRYDSARFLNGVATHPQHLSLQARA